MQSREGRMCEAKERGHRHWQDWALAGALAAFWALGQFLVLRGAFILDSDGVTPFLQANDMLHGNWLLSGWTGAPDNYYTLDVFLSVVCQGLFGFSLTVYLFQSLITYGGVMVGAIRLSRASDSAWWINGALLFLFLGLLTGTSLQWIMLVGGHVATLAVALLCFSLAAHLGAPEGGAPRRAAWFAFGGLSFLALAGDPFYKYIGWVPILAAAGLAALRYGRWRALIKLFVVSVLALVAAKILVSALKPFKQYIADFDTIQGNLYTYARSLWILLGAWDGNLLWLGGALPLRLAQGFLGLRLLAAVVAVGWSGKILLAKKSTENPKEAFIDSVLLAGIAVDSAAYIFSTLSIGVDVIPTCRYLVPAVVYASILVVRRCGPALSSRWSAARPGMRLFAPMVFFASLAMFVPRVLELSKGQPNAADVQLAEYLEARGLRSGLGGYWQSKIITQLSGQKVKVAGVVVTRAAKVAPFYWLAKESWFDAPANFIVYDPGDLNFNVEAPAIKTFGRPDEIAEVGQFRVLIWGRDIHAELDQPDFDVNQPWQFKFPLDLIQLRQQALAPGVKRNDDGSIEDEQKYPQAKIVIFGPYIHIPAGRYRATFVFSASEVADADSVICDATIRLGRKILARTEISGHEWKNETTPITVTLTFECPSPQEGCEFRVWKAGGMKLNLQALTLDKA
jgi:hypothetical protein